MAPRPKEYDTAELKEAEIGADSLLVHDPATVLAASSDINNMLSMFGGKGMTLEQCLEILQQKATIASFVKAVFPGARAGSQTLSEVASVIAKYGLTDDNTLFAESCCPDEINHDPASLPSLLANHLGEVFHMGGLGGIPFTGKTGFGAFSHHVPEDGHAFILMASHVGVTDCLKLGMYGREGQTGHGAACGAAVGAFGKSCHCKATGAPLPDMMADPSDYQMNFLCHQIHDKLDSILENEGCTLEDMENLKNAKLAAFTHDVGKNMLDHIVSTDFGAESSTLVLLTGIQINMPRPFEDYFQPLSFELRRKDGSVVDLMTEAFAEFRPIGRASIVNGP